MEGSTVSFDKTMSKKIREEYSTLQFFPERSLVSRDETLAIFNRRFLKMSNWTDGEIDALGDLSETEESRLRELLDRKSKQKLGAQREQPEGRAHGRGEKVDRGGLGVPVDAPFRRGRDQAAAPLMVTWRRADCCRPRPSSATSLRRTICDYNHGDRCRDQVRPLTPAPPLEDVELLLVVVEDWE